MKRESVFKKSDRILIGVLAALLFLGIITLSSVSASLSQEKYGNTYYFLNHQVFFGIIPGLILAFLAFRIPVDWIKKWALALLLINLILVALVFVPKIGVASGGATRWLSLWKINFQPAEFLKLTFILYLASWLTSRSPKETSAGRPTKKESKIVFSQTLIAFLVMIGLISLLLIFQPNVSTLGIIVLTGILMYFATGTPIFHIILIILIGAAGLYSLIKFEPYRMRRWTVFLNPETDPLGMGYQIRQAIIAAGSGGVFGLGLGMSRQKFGFLPQPMSDSIFAVFLEETGFLGAAILIFLFLIFLWRGFKILKEARDKFSRLAGLGITFWIVFQAFANMGSMIGILPLSGIPLPFISYGGSHMAAELIGVGILLNISKQKQ